MKLFGLPLFERKALPATLSPVSSYGSGGWWPRVLESFTGAWQSNVVVDRTTVLSYSAVYACISLISGDVGKMRVKLVQQLVNRIWKEIESPAFSPVLRKPNRYQNRVQFFGQWITCKLMHGNTYALKQRDNRGVVVALYILDPLRVTPLVAADGGVYYSLKSDNLSGLTETEIVVPAREIIHDKMSPALFHSLIGVSPIFACGLASTQGVNIQTNSALLFANMSRPGGILTAPGAIDDATALRLKATWEANFGGANAGKTAVVGDGLKYESMSMNAVDAQLIQQLQWTAEIVCSCFHVPPYMIGVGPMPAYNNIEALNQQYYQQCLQILIESLELCLDEGLELPNDYGTEFDLTGLLRMDTATRFKSYSDGIGGGWMSPNWARLNEDMPPVEGGDTPYLQQQNYSLGALNKRDTTNPFPAAPASPALAAPQPDPPPDDAAGKQALVFAETFIKGLAEVAHVI